MTTYPRMKVVERFTVAAKCKLPDNSEYLPNSWTGNTYKYRTTPISLQNKKKNEFRKPIHNISKVYEQKSTNPTAHTSTTSRYYSTIQEYLNSHQTILSFQLSLHIINLTEQCVFYKTVKLRSQSKLGNTVCHFV